MSRPRRAQNPSYCRAMVDHLERRVLLAAQVAPSVHRDIAPDAVVVPLAAASLTTITVNGSALWTDSLGNTHGIPLAYVEIRSTSEANTSPALATLQTDQAGNYTGSLSIDLSGGPVTLFARIFARNPAADVKPDSDLVSNPTTYTMDSATVTVSAAGTFTVPTRVASNNIVSEEAFGLLGATLETATYVADLTAPASSMPSQLDVRFPSDTAARGPASFFDPDTKQLFVTQTRVFDWDTIQHEYGHYVMDIYGFDADSSGNHAFFTANPKPGGPGLAWDEGWATFFAISAQVFSGSPAYATGVPEVGDTSYDPTGGPPGSNPYLNLANDTGVGETDEASVACALYHLAAGDEGIQISDQQMFQTFAADKPTTLGAAYLDLTQAMSGQDRSLVGHILGLQNVAPVIAGPADSTQESTTSIPTFSWDAGSSNDFVLQFYSSNFKTLIDQTADLGDVTSYTPSAGKWQTIFDGHSTVKWVVEGMNTTSPTTPGSVPDQTYTGQTLDRYWSSAGTINPPGISLVIDDSSSMTNEISTIQSAMSQFIENLQSNLTAGQSAPTIELITFTSAPVEVISSNNLAAVLSAVDAITPAGGGTTNSSEAAVIYAGKQIGAGGTILLATDTGSTPGNDLTQTIADLRADGVTFNADISGDSSDGGQNITTGDGEITTNSSQAFLTDAALPAILKSMLPTAAVHAQLPLAYSALPASQATPAQPPADDGPEYPQHSITDTGQLPVASDGSSPATATWLPTTGKLVDGQVGAMVQDSTGQAVVDNSAYFAMNLTADTAYNIPVLTTGTANVAVNLLSSDGATTLESETTSANSATLRFTPSASGVYYINVMGANVATPYTIGVSSNPVIGEQSSIREWSTVAAQTGGEFLYKPEIATSNGRSTVTDYQSTILNVLDSTVGPAVLSATPSALPAGAQLEVTLTGRNTNWSQGSTAVSFGAGSGIEVDSVNVLSPTSLTAMLTIASGASAGSFNATVTTSLGATSETATGLDVAQVVAAPSGPTLLQVEPTNLLRGQSTTVTLIGTMTNWNSSATISLGPGISLSAIHVISPDEITATALVDPAAEVGFRAASVQINSGESDTLQSGVFVTGASVSSIPSIATALPSEIAFGGQAVVGITGVNTHFVQGTTSVSFGAGVTVTSLDVVDSTHLTATISVSSNASAGYRNITVTTGTESAASLDGFFVTPSTTPVVAGSPAQGAFSGQKASLNVGSFSIAGPGPYSIDINWGDGTADTVLAVNSTGAIPAQPHAYATGGTRNVTITVTNLSAASNNVGSASETVTVTNDAALIVTDPRAAGALSIQGTLVATGGGQIDVNSASKSAAIVSPRALAQGIFNIVGSATRVSKFTGKLTTGVTPSSVPLMSLAAPILPTNVFKALRINTFTSITIQPGEYVGGIHISNRAQVTFAPGLYYIASGGFSVTGKSDVSGSGVTIYLAKGAMTVTSTLNLTPALSGAYKGIMFLQSPLDRSAINISGNVTITGAIVAEAAHLNLAPNASFADNADAADVIDALTIFSDVHVASGAEMTIDSASNLAAGLFD